jgi:glycosyltransferase involved in cell wall biosynthesis
MIRQHKLEDIVFFEGWVSGEKKTTLLQESDVYVLPSYFEAMPLSILEAMSYGLPVIATTVGGVPEIVKNGKNGFLITPGDKKELAKSIKMFLHDMSLLRAYGETSSCLVQPYFAKNVLPKLEKIYNGLLEK